MHRKRIHPIGLIIRMNCIFVRRAQVTGISQHHMATASGLSDYDYQNLSNLTMGLKNLNQIETVTKVPIPTEIMEHFKSNLCVFFASQSVSLFSSPELAPNDSFLLIFSRYKMSLYDGVVPRNRPSMVDHRFGYLCEYISTLLAHSRSLVDKLLTI